MMMLMKLAWRLDGRSHHEAMVDGFLHEFTESVGLGFLKILDLSELAESFEFRGWH